MKHYLFLVLLVALAGCAPQESAPPATAPPSSDTPQPPMKQEGLYDDLTPTPELDTKIADAEKAGEKKAIAAAYTERGYFRMRDEKAGMRIKYRKALSDLRAALKADPNNEKAKAAKDEIERIYTSMGREIPKEGQE